MTHPDGFQILVALDQLINTLIGGYADETLSSRAHRRRLRGKGGAVFFYPLRRAFLYLKHDKTNH